MMGKAIKIKTNVCLIYKISVHEKYWRVTARFRSSSDGATSHQLAAIECVNINHNKFDFY